MAYNEPQNLVTHYNQLRAEIMRWQQINPGAITPGLVANQEELTDLEELIKQLVETIADSPQIDHSNISIVLTFAACEGYDIKACLVNSVFKQLFQPKKTAGREQATIYFAAFLSAINIDVLKDDDINECLRIICEITKYSQAITSENAHRKIFILDLLIIILNSLNFRKAAIDPENENIKSILDVLMSMQAKEPKEPKGCGVNVSYKLWFAISFVRALTTQDVSGVRSRLGWTQGLKIVGAGCSIAASIIEAVAAPITLVVSVPVMLQNAKEIQEVFSEIIGKKPQSSEEAKTFLTAQSLTTEFGIFRKESPSTHQQKLDFLIRVKDTFAAEKEYYSNKNKLRIIQSIIQNVTSLLLVEVEDSIIDEAIEILTRINYQCRHKEATVQAIGGYLIYCLAELEGYAASLSVKKNPVVTAKIWHNPTPEQRAFVQEMHQAVSTTERRKREIYAEFQSHNAAQSWTILLDKYKANKDKDLWDRVITYNIGGYPLQSEFQLPLLHKRVVAPGESYLQYLLEQFSLDLARVSTQASVFSVAKAQIDKMKSFPTVNSEVCRPMIFSLINFLKSRRENEIFWLEENLVEWLILLAEILDIEDDSGVFNELTVTVSNAQSRAATPPPPALSSQLSFSNFIGRYFASSSPPSPPSILTVDLKTLYWFCLWVGAKIKYGNILEAIVYIQNVIQNLPTPNTQPALSPTDWSQKFLSSYSTVMLGGLDNQASHGQVLPANVDELQKAFRAIFQSHSMMEHNMLNYLMLWRQIAVLFLDMGNYSFAEIILAEVLNFFKVLKNPNVMVMLFKVNFQSDYVALVNSILIYRRRILPKNVQENLLNRLRDVCFQVDTFYSRHAFDLQDTLLMARHHENMGNYFLLSSKTKEAGKLFSRAKNIREAQRRRS